MVRIDSFAYQESGDVEKVFRSIWRPFQYLSTGRAGTRTFCCAARRIRICRRVEYRFSVCTGCNDNGCIVCIILSSGSAGGNAAPHIENQLEWSMSLVHMCDQDCGEVVFV